MRATVMYEAGDVRVEDVGDATIVEPTGALMPSLLTLSDVMGTGHHAVVVAGVGPGKSVAVVGDGYRAMDDREAIKVMVRP